MTKSNQIKKVVNGEIADADDINQIVENAGSEGGLLPYSDVNQQRVVDGSESLGSTAFPWGNLFVYDKSLFVEVAITNHTAASSVAWDNLRRFIYQKDTPASYVGNALKALRVNAGETGVEFSASESIPKVIEVFTTSGTWTRPANVNKVWIKLWGGGGGGAGGNGSNFGGGGGAGGGYVEGLVDVSGNVSVTIGDGGVGGAGTGSDGADGGDSSFTGDDILIANGGDGGAVPSGSGGLGGPGGTVPGGEIAFNGMDGETAHQQFGGQGGSSFGSPGGAGGRPGTSGGPGQSGSLPGAGGGGGAGDGATGGAGGDGFRGQCIIIY